MTLEKKKPNLPAWQCNSPLFNRVAGQVDVPVGQVNFRGSLIALLMMFWNLCRILIEYFIFSPSLQETSKDSYLNPAGEFIGHGLPGGQVYMSPHQRWIASGGTDGRVFVRAIGNLDRTTEMVPHDYRSGGIQTVAFSGDGQNILTTGFDGTMCCYKWV